jgi:ABC-type multidrug transport system fused ATPase/permease subunit
MRRLRPGRLRRWPRTVNRHHIIKRHSDTPTRWRPASGRNYSNVGRTSGTDVRQYALQGLRDQIAYVLQETVLFRGTIAENIAYGRGGATRDDIVAAAKLANADEFIVKMPLGYDTLVGERGETLSGGQRQRIGIARALVRDNPILILDEPTAALDTESERLVVEALERLMKGRTVIAIAHRLSTIRDAGKIVVIKDGVVAEEGTHDALMSRGGPYAELYRLQFAKPSPPTGLRAAS